MGSLSFSETFFVPVAECSSENRSRIPVPRMSDPVDMLTLQVDDWKRSAMSGDEYALARREVGEILSRCEEVRSAEAALLDYLGTPLWDAGFSRQAVASRMVALLTRGIEDPKDRARRLVIAPDGRVITVHVVDGEQNGMQGGQAVRLASDAYDELAMVVFQDTVPSVVHIIDKEKFASVAEHLNYHDQVVTGLWDGAMALSQMFHLSMILDPLVSEVLGVRTFVLDETESVGWRRLTSL